MNYNKKLFRLPILGVIMTLFSSIGVLADSLSDCKDLMGGLNSKTFSVVWSFLCQAFIFIGKLSGSEGSNVAGLGFMKVLLFVIIFVVGYKLLRMTKFLEGASGFILAFVLGLIGAIFTPQTILVAAMANYTLLMSTLFLILPIGVGIFAFYGLKEHHWIRFFIAIIMTYSWWHISDVFKPAKNGTTAGIGFQTFGGLGNAMWWITFIFLVGATIYSLSKALMGYGGATANRPNKLGHWFNKGTSWLVANNVPGTAAYMKRRNELNLISQKLDILAQEQTTENSLRELHSHMNNLASELEILKSKDSIDKNDVEQFNNLINEAKENINNLDKELKAKVRKEEIEIKAAASEFKSLTGKDLKIKRIIEDIKLKAKQVKDCVLKTEAFFKSINNVVKEGMDKDKLEIFARNAREIATNLSVAEKVEEEIGKAAGEVSDMITNS